MPFPLPPVVLSDSHERLSEAVHAILELMLTPRLPPPLLKSSVPGEALSSADAPAWETVIVTFVAPEPLKVIVPLRALVEVLAWAVAVIVPLPLPLVVLNDNQERLSEAVHEILELILRLSPPPPLLKFRVPGVALSSADAPAWETVIVTFGAPEPLSVIVPLRALVEVFAWAVAVIVPLPLPLVVLSEMNDARRRSPSSWSCGCVGTKLSPVQRCSGARKSKPMRAVVGNVPDAASNPGFCVKFGTPVSPNVAVNTRSGTSADPSMRFVRIWPSAPSASPISPACCACAAPESAADAAAAAIAVSARTAESG